MAAIQILPGLTLPTSGALKSENALVNQISQDRVLLRPNLLYHMAEHIDRLGTDQPCINKIPVSDKKRVAEGGLWIRSH